LKHSFQSKPDFFDSIGPVATRRFWFWSFPEVGAATVLKLEPARFVHLPFSGHPQLGELI
jgi:hypothetical protein